MREAGGFGLMAPLRLALCLAISILALSAMHTGLTLTYGAASSHDRPPAPRHEPEAAALSPSPPPPPRLDGSLEAALSLASPRGEARVVVLTFGNAKVGRMLDNFVAHALASATPCVVGAVDLPTFARLSREGAAVYKTPLALEEGYRMDGRNDHSSASWRRFAVMRTGEVARVVAKGYDVLHSDVDVVWLRSPLPYVRCSAEDVASGGGAVGPRPVEAAIGCGTLRAADVAVSSDNMSPGDDFRRGVSYAIGGTLNTGLLLVRATEAGTRFAAAWHATVASPPAGRQFAPPGCCTSDQQVFNRMVRDERLPYPGLRLPAGTPRHLAAWNGSVALGVLPLALFANGHHQFVQNASARLGVRPLAVHATYSLDRHDDVAKTQRFREQGLWRVDPPEYFKGKFLVLRHAVSPELAATIDRYVKRGMSGNNIVVHLQALKEYVLELRDALALSRALGRTLVLPRWMCYCDRLWSGSDDIFHFGCMYPGSQAGFPSMPRGGVAAHSFATCLMLPQDADFLPFVCPMDHVLSPAEWEAAGQPYRDAAFLEDSRVSGPPVEIALTPRAEYKASSTTAPAHAAVVLPTPLDDEEAKRRLAPFSASPLLALPHARSLLCGISSEAERREFNDLAQRLLRIPDWCSTCFSKCSDELAKWFSPEEIAAGADGPNRWCARFQVPPPLRPAHDGCGDNAAI